MIDGSDDGPDLEAQALRVLEKALAPSEDDPSRVSLVAALFVLRRRGDSPNGADPTAGASPRAGGIDLEGTDEARLDDLLGHLDGGEEEG